MGADHESPCNELVEVKTEVKFMGESIERAFVNVEKLAAKMDDVNTNLGTIITANDTVRSDLKISNRNQIITILIAVILILAGIVATYFKPDGSARAQAKPPGVEAPR
jgi:hypothetical protein